VSYKRSDDANDLDDDNDGISDAEEGFSSTTESVDLSGWVEGSLLQTFNVTPDIDVRISFSSINGSFSAAAGPQAPYFDDVGGLFGGADDLAIVSVALLHRLQWRWNFLKPAQQIP